MLDGIRGLAIGKDKRGKVVVLAAHDLLRQRVVSDGFAVEPTRQFGPVLTLLLRNDNIHVREHTADEIASLSAHNPDKLWWCEFNKVDEDTRKKPYLFPDCRRCFAFKIGDQVVVLRERRKDLGDTSPAIEGRVISALRIEDVNLRRSRAVDSGEEGVGWERIVEKEVALSGSRKNTGMYFDLGRKRARGLASPFLRNTGLEKVVLHNLLGQQILQQLDL